MIELDENISYAVFCLKKKKRIRERHKLPRCDIRVSALGLPGLQDSIAVIVHCGADDHCSPGHTTLVAGARHDLGCCQSVVCQHWICNRRKLRVWEGPGRIVPRAVVAGECRLAASIKRRKRCVV